MKNFFFAAFLVFFLTGCKSTRTGSTAGVELRFLDDYVIPADAAVDGTRVGGLSGIDYHEGKFFLVSDQPSNPRIYTAEIEIEGKKISDVSLLKVTELSTASNQLKGQHLDLEGIIFDPEEEKFLLSSEGAIKKGKDPMVFSVSKTGEFVESFSVPANFLANSEKDPRNNGTFEGLASSFDGAGIWIAMELPLKTDGPKPKLIRTKSPVRITRFNRETGEPVKQFAYRLEPIAKIPWFYFAVNGVTDLLEYAPERFLVLERGYASGHGQKGITLRIFDVDTRLATNTLNRNNLSVTFYNPANKKLLYDFKWAKKFLSQGFIDNIEGITFGPELPNGNRTILLVSDNNFNAIGPQLNQVILMEIKLKK